MQLLKIISLSFILLNFYSFSNKACAKDLTHRFGIGLKNNTSESLPSIAAVYFPMAEIAVTGGFGMDTRKDNSRFQVHGGVRKIFFTEANLNFYTGAQFGLAQFETAFDGIQSGLEIHGVFGVEFFFPLVIQCFVEFAFPVA